MKRVFWGSMGYAAGLGTSVYVQRRVRRVVVRYTSDEIRRDVADRGRRAAERARDVVVDLRDAATEGVEAMRLREQELRAEYAPTGGDERRPAHAHRPARITRR